MHITPYFPYTILSDYKKELGIEGFDKATHKYFDKTYDKIDPPDKKRNTMNDQQRYSSQPPAHRGYDNDRYNDYYDDEAPRGPKPRGGGGRDRYDPSDWRPQSSDQPRYTNVCFVCLMGAAHLIVVAN